MFEFEACSQSIASFVRITGSFCHSPCALKYEPRRLVPNFSRCFKVFSRRFCADFHKIIYINQVALMNSMSTHPSQIKELSTVS